VQIRMFFLNKNYSRTKYCGFHALRLCMQWALFSVNVIELTSRDLTTNDDNSDFVN